MKKTSFLLTGVLIAALALVPGHVQAQTKKSLDIYFIDVEGGGATLLISPTGETMLVDAGNPGEHDSGRILAQAKAAGVHQIDYAVVTHYDVDHIGGFAEVAAQLPIRNFVDHGGSIILTSQGLVTFNNYVAAREKGRHIIAVAGDKIPISGLDVQVVIAGGEAIKKPLKGAGAPNPLCANYTPQDELKGEDPQSLGVVIRIGRFSFIDLGDLTPNKEYDLVCPNNNIGTIDLYQTDRHGINPSGPPVFVHALHPRVAVMNNGPKKGASREAWLTVHSSPGLEDLWQVHYSVARPPSGSLSETAPSGGPELNTSEQLIANLDEDVNHTMVYNLKVSAGEDGSFVITNPRNGYSKEYKARR